MKLLKIILKNFRTFRNETIVEVDDLTALIGKNDAGKSSIMEALNIFFNSAACGEDDCSVDSECKEIEISCEFSDFPQRVVLDATAETNLRDEYLLNEQGNLQIKKVIDTTKGPKSSTSSYFVCNHPAFPNAADLMQLKHKQLQDRATEMDIPSGDYQGNKSASIRKAIRDSIGDQLQLQNTILPANKEDCKKVIEQIEKYFPMYALFRVDRESSDEDKEVTDPMSVAVKQALDELESELSEIMERVREWTTAAADRTLEKLNELSPELASELKTDFKAEPKFHNLFKLTIESDDGISVNKRGSGVRRLILLSFFRAEAEKNAGNRNIIYAIEEPETSQHPDHQEMIIESLKKLSTSENCQIVLSTHSPSIAGLLPTDSLRLVEKISKHVADVSNEGSLKEIVETLGLLPHPLPKDAVAVLLVEGESDFLFVRHASTKLSEAEYISLSLEDAHVAVLPVGGIDHLKFWSTMKLVEQFELPYCVMMDADHGSNPPDKNEEIYQHFLDKGILALKTRRSCIENYIHPDCLALDEQLSYEDKENVKKFLTEKTGISGSKLIKTFWVQMNAGQIREVEEYTDSNGEVQFEFSKFFSQIIELRR